MPCFYGKKHLFGVFICLLFLTGFTFISKAEAFTAGPEVFADSLIAWETDPKITVLAQGSDISSPVQNIVTRLGNHLYLLTDSSLIKWNITTKQIVQNVSTGQIASWSYDKFQKILLVANNNGDIYTLAIDGDLTLNSVVSGLGNVCGVTMAGTFVFVCHLPPPNTTSAYELRSTYTMAGELLSTIEILFPNGSQFQWSSINGYIYLQTISVSPKDLHYQILSPSGLLGSEKDSPQHSTEFGFGKFKLADSLPVIIHENHRIYDLHTMAYLKSFAHIIQTSPPFNETPHFREYVWYNNNAFQLWSKRDSTTTSVVRFTTLIHLNANYLMNNLVEVPGDPVGMAQSGGEIIVFSKLNGANFIWLYTPDIIDTDSDGVNDFADQYPVDPAKWSDTADFPTNTDTDQDGIDDAQDAFPNDPFESVDTDGDGIGNNSDLDDDGDGVYDVYDIAPLDPSESTDIDSDGVGDNSDSCPDKPNALQWDSDGDGIGNACDPDVFPGGPHLLPSDFSEYFRINQTDEYYFSSHSSIMRGISALSDYTLTEDINLQQGMLVVTGFSATAFVPSVFSGIYVNATFDDKMIMFPPGASIGDEFIYAGNGEASFSNIDITFYPYSLSYTAKLKLLALEEITVNFGTFQALRVNYRLEANTIAARLVPINPIYINLIKDVDLWYVRGIGLVRSMYNNTTSVFELLDTNFLPLTPGPVNQEPVKLILANGLLPFSAKSDSDKDGIFDIHEVGDLNTPIDTDSDGIIDALEPGDAAYSQQSLELFISTTNAESLNLPLLGDRTLRIDANKEIRAIPNGLTGLPVYHESDLSVEDNQYDYSYGIIKLSSKVGNNTLQLTLTLPDNVSDSDNFTLRALNYMDQWQTIESSSYDPLQRKITFSIVDNSPIDRAFNSGDVTIFIGITKPGIVVDNPIETATGTGGGGCTVIQQSRGFDPTLLIFILLAIFHIARSANRRCL